MTILRHILLIICGNYPCIRRRSPAHPERQVVLANMQAVMKELKWVVVKIMVPFWVP